MSEENKEGLIALVRLTCAVSVVVILICAGIAFIRAIEAKAAVIDADRCRAVCGQHAVSLCQYDMVECEGEAKP